MYSSCIGKFICFEGIEGVGKSTNIKFLSEELNKYSVDHIVTREPGGTQIGEMIREIFLGEKILPITELLLMFAARAEHIEQVIAPALKEGKCVLCDRFTDASYAYQGGGRNLDLSLIRFLENTVQKNLTPDLVLLFDLSVGSALERARTRGKLDRIEEEKVEFFTKVREVYFQRAKLNCNKYKIFDASKSLDLIQLEIIDVVRKIN